MTETYYLPRTVDLNSLFRMACPVCGHTARVQGNAMHIWIVQHDGDDGSCAASGWILEHARD